MSQLDRRREIHRKLEGEIFDLVIVGGGITGASIARDAALRGYRVALVEQHDFAFGTSSRSSRLVHGGLRYLEQGDLRLVFESVTERALLSRLARHLVRPLPFILPVYRDDPTPLWLVDIGLWIYDGFAAFRSYRRHQRLPLGALSTRTPGLRREQLTGGVLYYDCQTDDARLVLENALDARDHGAALLSYCRVDRFEKARHRIEAAIATDRLSGEELRIRGRVFVVAAGPWTDALLETESSPSQRWLRPSKGVHIVVPGARLPIGEAFVLRHPEDQRVLFLLPFHEDTVIGTTDTDFSGDTGDVQADAEDVRYLLAAANHAFPAAMLGAEDVRATWAGIRPLLVDGDALDPSAVSREHRIEVRNDGMVVIAGGKLTTYRRMAAECLDNAAASIGTTGGTSPRLRCRTHRLPLPGSRGLGSEADLFALARELGQPFEGGATTVGTHLACTYGVRARAIARLAQEDRATARRVVPGLPYVWAELLFALREEIAVSLEDLLIRRTQLFYRAPDNALAAAEELADLAARELGWSAEETRRQLEAFTATVESNRQWKWPQVQGGTLGHEHTSASPNTSEKGT